MRVVLIGKNGQLGWELQRTLPVLGEVIPLGRAELDLAEPASIQKFIAELKPNLIINASAYTEVDLAETQGELARRVNAEAPGILADTARHLGAVFVHYSTDYVFDGQSSRPYTENDTPNPLNEYAKSKYLGEKNIQQVGNAFLILRTSWVYSLRGNSFVNKVLGWARKNTALKVVNDQISNPTWARALAKITTSVLEQNKHGFLEKIRDHHGLYHVSGSGFTSRYEWAKRILALDPNRTEQLAQSVEPVSSDEFPTPALRPLFTALDCSKFEQVFGVRLPAWEESLREALAELAGI